jgi:hypothetical protein
MARTPYNPTMGQRVKDNAGSSVDMGFVAHYTIPAASAVAPSATAVRIATVLGDGLTTTLTTADINQPAVPRVLSITGNAASAVGNVVITGTDAAGDLLVETIVSTGAATVVGTRAFASIETIVLPARGAGGDTISVGLAGAFGIPFTLPHDTVIKILNNSVVTTVAAGSAFSATVLAGNYIIPTAALNAQQIDVYLVV